MLAVAFEGCACRAAFHAGVAAALAESGLPIRLAAGASSGSLIATSFAAGNTADLPAIWRGLGGRSLVSFRRMLWNRSIFDMSHIVRRTLEGVLAGRDLRGAPVEALVTATRLPDLRRIVYSSRREPEMIDPLLGSCFFPVFYGRPVRVRGDWLVDGGLTDNLPIEALVESGATEIIAVVTATDGTALKNPRRGRLRPAAFAPRAVPVHVIHPSTPLAIKSWDFDPDRLARALDDGYARGMAFVDTGSIRAQKFAATYM